MNKVLIVIPAYNEEKIISQNLKKLYDYAKLNLPGHIFNIIVADNNSNDQTGSLVKELPKLYPEIDYEFYKKDF